MPCSSVRQANKVKLPGKTSSYFGVYWYHSKTRPKRQGWRCAIRIDGKVKTFGPFETELLAYQKYLEEAEQYYGRPMREDDPNTREIKSPAE